MSKKSGSDWENLLTLKRFPKSGKSKYFKLMRTQDGSLAIAMGEYGGEKDKDGKKKDGKRYVIKLESSEVALLCFALARELLV